MVGACFEVYNTLGHGLLEAVYQEALELEFSIFGIPFTSQPKLNIQYKGHDLKQYYVPDFVCFDAIVLEIKSAKNIDSAHCAQLLNSLKLSKKKLGILANFGSHPNLQHERFAL